MAFTVRSLISGLPLALLAAVVSTLASAGFAQDAEHAEPVAFTVFARHPLKGLCFFPDEASPPQALEFFGSTRSRIYRNEGGRSIAFYLLGDDAARARTKSADSPAPRLPRPVARARVPKHIRRALLVFVATAPAGKTKAPRWRVLVIDDERRSLPDQHIALLNLAGRTYKARLSNTVLEVPPGLGRAVLAQGPTEFRLTTQEPDRWQLAGRSVFNLGPKERMLVILFPPDRPTRIAPILRPLIDTLPAESGN